MRLIIRIALFSMLFSVISCLSSQNTPLLTEDIDMKINERINEIISRPEFEDARWGMEFYLPRTGELIFTYNNDDFFQPASSMKIFTAGTAYEYLGPDYRFRTPVYRTGVIENGILHGDIVVIASGDLLLGGRMNNDGTINLPAPDHSYDISAGAGPVSDDPLLSLRNLADEIAALGIRQITGNIFVDNSLFREEDGEAGGTGVFTVSSMVINDNLIDVTVLPGATIGAPGELRITPASSYLTIINNTITITATGVPATPGMIRQNPISFTNNITHADGRNTVTITGEIPIDSGQTFRAYRIPEPSIFAEMVIVDLLNERDITVRGNPGARLDFQALSRFYLSENLLTEIVSETLDFQVLPMLKLSANPHTVAWYYLLGSIIGNEYDNAFLAGMDLQNNLFIKAGIDPSMWRTGSMGTTAQSTISSLTFNREYKPATFTRFLTFLYNQPYFERFKNTLPILGIDGTLAGITSDSRAAGNVYAKTGSSMGMTMRDGVRSTIFRSALAGFMELPDNEIIVFSAFLDYSPQTQDITGAREVMGEIVNVIYDAFSHNP
ncbi:MAG: D-alanyl-D-alanine carboxypeptidase [Treponema sp.]|nr:D-alanyl-D-alanine carboxypeptidase [Treponema sp.]